MIKNNKDLMPQGFYDYLNEYAYGEIKLNFSIIEQLSSYGYSLVRPAFAEFEESLDKNFSSELFKVTDPESGKMLAIRNDITPQIARIVKDRFSGAEKPLRLSYTGQVLRKTGSGKYKDRQLTQTGFELVGAEGSAAIKEVIYLGCKILQDNHLTDFAIDISIPNLSEIVFEEIGLDDSLKAEIQEHIENKEISLLKKDDSLSKVAEIISLYEKATDVENALIALDNILNLLSSAAAKELIEELKEMLAYISKHNLIENVSLNLFEKSEFSYHTGICFSFLSNSTYEELGRGGKYEISTSSEGGDVLNAVGCTFMVSPIIRSIPDLSDGDAVACESIPL